MLVEKRLSISRQSWKSEIGATFPLSDLCEFKRFRLLKETFVQQARPYTGLKPDMKSKPSSMSTRMIFVWNNEEKFFLSPNRYLSGREKP